MVRRVGTATAAPRLGARPQVDHAHAGMESQPARRCRQPAAAQTGHHVLRAGVLARLTTAADFNVDGSVGGARQPEVRLALAHQAGRLTVFTGVP